MADKMGDSIGQLPEDYWWPDFIPFPPAWRRLYAKFGWHPVPSGYEFRDGDGSKAGWVKMKRDG